MIGMFDKMEVLKDVVLTLADPYLSGKQAKACLHDIWDNLSAEEQQEVINELFDDITAEPDVWDSSVFFENKKLLMDMVKTNG